MDITVNEMIERLKKFDGELPVEIHVNDVWHCDLDGISEVTNHYQTCPSTKHLQISVSYDDGWYW